LSERNSKVLIFNLNGEQMDDSQIDKGLSQIDVSNYPSGMYFIVSGGQVFKFMKF
jgi:hypothetical protein